MHKKWNIKLYTLFSMSHYTSLLSKGIKQFAFCTFICFVLTAPLFYLLTKYFYAEDLIDFIEAVNRGTQVPQPDLERDIIAGMMLQYILIFSVITIAMFITTRIATQSLWRPFDDTLQKAERFNLAQGQVPQFTSTSIKEFARLNHSLEVLMRKDKETYRIQKEFTENASHELQTPLAIIRSKLDLLLQENLGEKQMLLIADLYSITTRMTHLNNNLLLLAKIDNAQYTSLQQVDVYATLSHSLPLYEVLKGSATLKLCNVRKEKSPLHIEANSILFDCMTKNLIMNAIRHAKPHSQINVTITSYGLRIDNTANNNQPLDAEKIFSRFCTSNDLQTSNATAATHQHGNGLGLAIVKAICDFHHWQIHYYFQNERHVFEVQFLIDSSFGFR